MKVIIDGIEYVPLSKQSKAEQLVQLFAMHRGASEYNGIVATIQKWYYGSVVKASWCATSLSYFASQAGFNFKKQENVYQLLKELQSSSEFTVYTKKNIPQKIERGDILFWLWAGTEMTTTSSKHVGIAEHASSSDTIYCLGGNQKDKICTLEYKRENLYAIARAK